MIVVKNYLKRKSKKGGEFFVLVLSGGIEPVRSAEGQLYFTSRTCTVAASFDENMCKDLIGTKFPGSIEKVPCEPYSYTIPNTDKVVELSYKWDYVDNPEEVMREQLLDSEVVH
ncbi:hypothetical protein E5167_11025 [Pontimicrobium aquaticum]|uniref:Uncharacterized protein n=2 Tax=Pontimicrobium aquaticum TaxID=2565367 RepID=A0A4U0ET61_9FLAO|nr:hypothetical protein E5167_11025 [Pontimicrobium aquaticum]